MGIPREYEKVYIYIDHMERKVPKYEKGKGKGKLLPKIKEISKGKAHTNT